MLVHKKLSSAKKNIFAVREAGGWKNSIRKKNEGFPVCARKKTLPKGRNGPQCRPNYIVPTIKKKCGGRGGIVCCPKRKEKNN